MTQPHALRSYGWLVLGYGGRTVAYLLLTVILATALDPAGFGQLSVFLAVAAGVAAVAGAWPFFAVPVLASGGEDMRPALRGALLLALGAGTVALLVTIPAADALMGEASPRVLLALAAYAMALIALQAGYAVLQAQERMWSIAAVQTAERALAALLVGALAVAGVLGVDEARIAVAVAGVLAGGAVSWILLRGLPARRTSTNRWADVRRVLRAVGPMGIVGVCGYLVAWFDVLALRLLSDDLTVGLYALAYQVFTVPLQMAALWVVATLPRHAREQRGVDATVDITGPLVLGWGGLVALFASAAALLLVVGFGEEYRGSAAPALVLVASAPPLIFYFAGVPILLAQSRAKVLAVLSVAGVAINVLLDVLLIPSMGLWAPVLATVAQNGCVTVAMVLVLRGGRLDLRLLLSLPASMTIALAALAPRAVTSIAAMTVVGGGCLVICVRELRRSRTVRFDASRREREIV